jgi:hypothetical protein
MSPVCEEKARGLESPRSESGAIGQTLGIRLYEKKVVLGVAGSRIYGLHFRFFYSVDADGGRVSLFNFLFVAGRLSFCAIML